MPLASANDVRWALQLAQDEEKARKTRVEALFESAARSVDVADQAAKQEVRPKVQIIDEKAKHLQAQLQNTSTTASHLYSKMQLIHEERQRVKLAIHWCRSVVDLKSACASLAESLERHDWDAGAAHCASASSCESSIIESRFAQNAVPTTYLPDPPTQTLHELRAKLLEQLRKNFEFYTIQESNEAQATRFLSLFGKAGAYDEGLDAYKTLAVSLVHAQGDGIRNKLISTPPLSPYYSALWGTLFDQIAIFIHEHQPVVDRLLLSDSKAGFVQGVLPGLDGEWTRLGNQILDAWDEKRQRTRLVQESEACLFSVVQKIRATPHTVGRIFGNVQSSNRERSLPFPLTRPSTPRATPPPKEIRPELGVVDVVLNELALFSSHWALFTEFLINSLGTTPSEVDSAAKIDAPHALDARINELLTRTFLPLQAWALRESLEKAHSIDTADLDARPMSSSLPDDLFFMLRSILTRALSTSSISVAERVLHQAVSLLETDFIDIVVLRLDSCRRSLNVPRLVEGPRRLAAAREVKATMIVYLNVLDQSSTYTERIYADLHSPAFLSQYFKDIPKDQHASTFEASDLALAQDVVSRLNSLIPKYGSAIQFEIGELYTTLIQSHMHAMVTDLLQDLTYELNEAAFEQTEQDNRIASRLQKRWELVMPSYRERLTESNYALLFMRCLDALLIPYEESVLEMHFSELGALRFDKDVRQLLGFLSLHCSFGIRDKFMRLQQIAFVLNQEEEDEEVYETGTSLGISWQLTPSEVKHVRGLCIR
ncbi:Golgi transport complex subunit 4 [Malassezia psittaci]|uniref:Conserved oligomeric Golgi complex subunit 4 n=1 Tax=Malassezia psittaci TaxID=1821823 RepID=A0AAF0JIN1_9BASI|nr:Golgi transport complex subunit 4 [Malassezia psittaci]